MTSDTLDAEWAKFSEDLAEYWEQVADSDYGHDPQSFEKLSSILGTFIAGLKTTPSGDRPGIDAIVTTCVHSLNGLNRAYDGSLLETDERELICEFLNNCVQHAGLDLSLYEDRDVTWPMREF